MPSYIPKCGQLSRRQLFIIILISAAVALGIILALCVITFCPYFQLLKAPGNGAEPNFEELKLPPCEVLTKSRSLDEYWSCLVSGPEAYLSLSSGEEQGQEQPPLSLIEDSYFRTIQRKTKVPKNASRRKIRRRVKRESEGYYVPLNPKYNISLHPITSENRDRMEPINDLFFSETPERFKPDANSEFQKNPPWSYHGQFGPKTWHKLELEKFFVPVNPTLDTVENNRLYFAAFSDIWGEHKFLDEDNSDGTKFGRIFFANRTDEEKLILFNQLYKDHTKNVVKLPKIFKVDPTTNVTSLDHSVRVLLAIPPHSGFYSFTRFYLPPRGSEAQIKANIPFLPPGTSHRLPPPTIDFNFAILHILDKLDRTPEEEKAYNLFLKIGSEWKPGADPHEAIEELVDELEEKRNEAAKKQSQFSLPLFPSKFPICQATEPSPIDIITKNAKTSSIVPYAFDSNARRWYKFQIGLPPDGTNVLSISFPDALVLGQKGIVMDGGATKGLSLYFEQMNLHFARERGGAGSEHKLDGKSFDMELQLIFSYKGPNKNQPFWFSLSRQVGDLFPYREKLVIILAVFVKVENKIKPEEELIFEPIVQAIAEYRKQGENSDAAVHYRSFESGDYAMRFIDYIPSNSIFYTYRGSLTFPPCFSYIVWSVYEKPLKISAKQFTELRLMKAEGTDDTEFVAGNIRSVDDLWVLGENLPGILPSQRKLLRDKRVNRDVLKSLEGTDGNFYDYYFDYGNAGNSLRLLNCALAAVIVAIIGSCVL